MLHLFNIIEISHWRGDELLWEARDLPNVLHANGEAYCLQCLFSTYSSSTVPYYFAGMDNRSALSVTDTMGNLLSEPTVFDYQRQAVSSSSGFVVSQADSGNFQAVTNLLVFTATGGTWGPVQTLFLATSSDNSGVLVSSVALDGPHTVGDGESLTLRLGVSLQNLS